MTRNTSTKRKEESPVKGQDTKRAKVDLEGKNIGNVVGGYKAASKNPNVSDEAKERAEETVDMLEDSADYKKKDTKGDHVDLEGKNEGNVIGGYRATISNPNSTEEARDHARKMLKELGASEEDRAEDQQRFSEDFEGKNQGNVIGGFRATLSNPNSSEEAKDHARAKLKELGASEESDYKYHQARFSEDFEGKEIGHVIGGFKATLSNANSSEEAKEHAKKMLRQLESEYGYNKEGRDLHHYASGYKSTLADKSRSKEHEHARRSLYDLEEHHSKGRHLGHIIGGYRATLSNPKTSEHAKEHARKMLKEYDADEVAPEEDNKNKNYNNVIGGYKATLHNPNSSEEAKRYAREVLEANGETEEPRTQGKEDSEKNPNNVMGGYKATLHNDRVSDDAKEHAKEVLGSKGVSADSKSPKSGKDDSEKNPGNVIGGLKASLKNPNVTDEKKEEIRERLDSSKAAY